MRIAVVLLLVISVALPVQANLLVNGGFESGNLSGWSAWSMGWGVERNTVQTTNAGSGSYSLCTLIGPGEKGSFGVYQEVSVTPGQTYKLSGLWKGSGKTTASWGVFLFNGPFALTQFESAPPETVAANLQAARDTWDLPPSSWDWQPISSAWYNDSVYGTGHRNGTLLAISNKMTLVLKMNGGFGLDTPVTGYWDDFSLSPVPEPASWVPLLLGVFGLWRMAKRH